jgi:cytochrome c peroxidase
MLKHELFTFAKRTSVRSAVVVLSLAGSLALSSCNKELAGGTGTDPNQPPSGGGGDPMLVIPTSPGAMNPGLDNPLGNAARVELGRHLFYDGRISIASDSMKKSQPGNKAPGISCGSCHDPSAAFTDIRAEKAGQTFSAGVFGKMGTRNAPALTNIGYNAKFTWDGKFASLEDHVPGPMFSQVEMGNNLSRFPGDGGDGNDGYDHTPGSNDTLLLFKRLNDEDKYASMFTTAYGNSEISLDRIVKAIAAFERTFVSTNSSFDSYNKALHNEGGDINAISASAKNGFKLFTDPQRANCVSCHSGYNFTDGKLHNNGLPVTNNDLGAAGVKGSNNALINFFKVPSLRNIAKTAPYMHNGSLATLKDVLAHYVKGGDGSSVHQIKPVALTDQEQADIIAFLESLTDNSFLANANFKNPWVN